VAGGHWTRLAADKCIGISIPPRREYHIIFSDIL